MRLNKFIAHTTNISRREADELISRGRVTINDKTAELGAQVTENDYVAVDHKHIGEKSTYTYIALNKPVGYLCSRRSQGGVPTIFELLPEKYRDLKPVGRLDKDSSGIILLTDDGDFAHQMTHPKFAKTKIYEVELDTPLQPLHQQMISDFGIQLEDGVSKFLVERTDPISNPQTYRITMHEGRNRQIRRTFAALGYTVTKLHRTQFGNFSLSDLHEGASRPVRV
jgi:23S rRNA pseudouridine2605 synthase